jgi:hypothetical protein
MPLALAVIGGAAISGGASLFGASQQANAVNSSSKAAQRAQEEARIIAQANLSNTLNTIGPRLEQAKDVSNAAVSGGNDLSRAYLSNGAIAAGDALGAGHNAADNDLRWGYNQAYSALNQGRNTIGQGVTNANALLQPYIDTGGRALGVVGDLSGANGVAAGQAALANFQASPAYDFNLQQGLRAIDAGASAKGMLVSGGTRRAEQTYGAGLASNEFGNYYNRLSALAGQGLGASNQAGANIMTGAGNQANFDRAQAQNATTLGAGLASNDTGLGTGLANIHTGLGTALSNNEMATAGRLQQNEQWAGGALSNLYTGNATQQANVGMNAANNQAQTLTSAGTAMANIYGGAAQGVGNAINSGMNNYAYINALAPQGGSYNVTTPNATFAPGQQVLQTGAVDPYSGVVIR